MGDLNGLWEKLALIDKEDDELEIIEEWSSFFIFFYFFADIDRKILLRT